jgi:hypothetical protein
VSSSPWVLGGLKRPARAGLVVFAGRAATVLLLPIGLLACLVGDGPFGGVAAGLGRTLALKLRLDVDCVPVAFAP